MKLCSLAKRTLITQLVKDLPAIQETQEMLVGSLGWEDPLEKEMATLSSILAWEIPWTEEPWQATFSSTKTQNTKMDNKLVSHSPTVV